MEKMILSTEQKDIIKKTYPKYADVLIRVIEKNVGYNPAHSLNDYIDIAFIFLEEKAFHAEDFLESDNDSSDQYSEEE